MTAVYAPYVGALPSHQHRNFLKETLRVAKAATTQNGLASLWLKDDFNLKGVAPGNSAPPWPGSCHASIAEEFTDDLRAAVLTALETAATQRRGGALGIHFTNTTPLDSVRLFDAPPGCPSDHKMSAVATMLMTPHDLPSHATHDVMPEVQVFN